MEKVKLPMGSVPGKLVIHVRKRPATPVAFPPLPPWIVLREAVLRRATEKMRGIDTTLEDIRYSTESQRNGWYNLYRAHSPKFWEVKEQEIAAMEAAFNDLKQHWEYQERLVETPEEEDECVEAKKERKEDGQKSGDGEQEGKKEEEETRDKKENSIYRKGDKDALEVENMEKEKEEEETRKDIATTPETKRRSRLRFGTKKINIPYRKTWATLRWKDGGRYHLVESRELNFYDKSQMKQGKLVKANFEGQMYDAKIIGFGETLKEAENVETCHWEGLTSEERWNVLHGLY